MAFNLNKYKRIRYPEIASSIELDLRANVHRLLNLAPETIEGRLVAAVVRAANDAWEAIESIRWDLDPRTARHEGLIQLSYIRGEPARQATNTTVTCRLTGQPGQLVPIGTVATDSLGKSWHSIQASVMSISGACVVDFQASEPGQFLINGNAIVSSNDVDSITTIGLPIDAQPAETEAELRSRLMGSRRPQSNILHQKLWSVVGVDHVELVGTEQGLRIIVWGQYDYDHIHAVIDDFLQPGTITVGGISPADGCHGFSFDVGQYKSVQVVIYVDPSSQCCDQHTYAQIQQAVSAINPNESMCNGKRCLSVAAINRSLVMFPASAVVCTGLIAQSVLIQDCDICPEVQSDQVCLGINQLFKIHDEVIINDQAVIPIDTGDTLNPLIEPVVFYPLTVMNGSGTGDHLAATSVQIVADTAPAGQVFDQWTGNTDLITDVKSPSTAILMPAQDSDGLITLQNFQSGTIGDFVASCGGVWEHNDWTIAAPLGTGNNSSQVAQGQGPDFATPFRMKYEWSPPISANISGVEPIIHFGYSAMVVSGNTLLDVEFSSTALHGPGTGIERMTGNVLKLFVKEYNHPSGGTKHYSDEILEFGKWYDIRVSLIDNDAPTWVDGVSKVSLEYRERGTQTWLKPAALQNIRAGWVSASNPTLATVCRVRLYRTAIVQMDNITFTRPDNANRQDIEIKSNYINE